jgi:hypothetical protein
MRPGTQYASRARTAQYGVALPRFKGRALPPGLTAAGGMVNSFHHQFVAASLEVDR